MRKTRALIFTVLLIQLSCNKHDNKEYLDKLDDPELFQSAMQNLTDIIVYDIFSPPVASRVYLYPTIAAYEIIAKYNPENFISLAGQVKDLGNIPKPGEVTISPNLAAIFCFNIVGKKLIFSQEKMESFENELNKKLIQYEVPKNVIRTSKNYAEKVAKFILEWASKDMYSQTRTFPKYSIKDEDKYWKPTPPDYMDGIEPHWQEIRTMVLDSSNQFPPKDPLPYNLKKDSPFHKQLMQVFNITNGLTKEQVEIAKFWDCNPYVTHHKGHLRLLQKKLHLEGIG